MTKSIICSMAVFASLVVAPLVGLCATRELSAAFDAVKRIPLVEMRGDGYETRRLDAEKALDAAKAALSSAEDKRLYSLLKATMESRSLARVDSVYGDLAIQCTREAFLAFSPDDLSKEATEAAKRGTCIADYKQTMEGLKAGKAQK